MSRDQATIAHLTDPDIGDIFHTPHDRWKYRMYIANPIPGTRGAVVIRFSEDDVPMTPAGTPKPLPPWNAANIRARRGNYALAGLPWPRRWYANDTLREGVQYIGCHPDGHQWTTAATST